MRVISGKFKSRKLIGFDEKHIRPMSDKVKESLFNILQGNIEGSTVLELYAGTGSLGIEAISRGALFVESVDSNVKSIQIIQKNLENLDIKSQSKIYKKDVIQFLYKYVGDGFDLIFIDPPFTQTLVQKTLIALSESNALKPNSIVAIEHPKNEPIINKVGSLIVEKQKDYGDKYLSILKKESFV